MALGPHAESEAEVLEPHEMKGTTGGRVPVTLVTPKGSLAEKPFDEVIAPGVEGEFGVLPGHVAFLSALKAGVLTLRDGTTRSYYAVGPGYLEVGAGGVCRILVETALLAGDVDVEATRTEERELREQLRATEEPSALLTAKLAWAQARLAAHAAAHK